MAYTRVEEGTAGKKKKEQEQSINQAAISAVQAAAAQALEIQAANRAQGTGNAGKQEPFPRVGTGRVSGLSPAQRLSAWESYRRQNPLWEMGPTPKQINDAYAKLVTAQSDYKRAAQKQDSLEKALTDKTMNYWLKSTAENKQGNLYRLSRDYAQAETAEEAEGIRQKFDEERDQLSSLLTANQQFYSDAVNKWNQAAADRQAAAQKIAESDSAYSRMINAYRLDRKELSSGAKSELQRRERQAEAVQKSYYEQQIAEIDRELDRLNQDPAGYLGQTGPGVLNYAFDKSDELMKRKRELENSLSLTERSATIAGMKREADNDPNYSQYVSKGKADLEANYETVKKLGGDTSWYDSYNVLPNSQKDMYAYLYGKDGNESRAVMYKQQAVSEYQAEQAQREQKEKERRQKAVSERYKQYEKNLDWARLSKYQPTSNGKKVSYITGSSGILSESGFDDIAYDYINKNPEATALVETQSIGTGAAFTGVDKRYLKQMTDKEVQTWNYLYQKDKTAGTGEANAYLKELEPILTERQRKADEEAQAREAKEHPILSSVFSVGTSPLKTVSYAGQLADYVNDGKIDQNAGYNKFSYNNAATRNAVSEIAEKKWGKPGSFLYQTAMSMGDFLLNTGITGGNEALSLTLMGSSAAADAVIDAKDRGLSDGQAFSLGTIAGLAEIATEKVSIEALLDKTSLDKNALGYFLKNVISEGSEEVGSDLINLTADVLISKDKSEWNQSIEAYKAQGYSESDAFFKALTDQAREMGLDFLGGALSGGVMAGAGIAGSRTIGGIQNRQNEKLHRQLVDSGILSEGEYNALMEGQGNSAESGGVKLQPAPKYSIAKTADGRNYVKVDTDQSRFDGLSSAEMQKEARNVILEKFRNKVIGTENQAYVNRKTAEEYSHPAKVLRNAEIKEAKMRASTELDNIMTVSRFIEHQNDDGRHADAVGGWDKYETTFKVGNRYYNGEISIKNTAKGRVLYDVTQIKDITGSPPLAIGKTNMAASTDDVFTNSIPNSSENVNGQPQAPKYSIQTLPDGEQITVLDTRQDIFEGKPQKDYAKIARREILDHFKGQVLPLGEHDLARITSKTASEYAYPHNQPEGILDTAKMKVSTELDNLLKTAEYVYSAEDTKKHREATLGFDYYKTEFVVDGHAFEGLLNIATSEKGRVLYDVTKITEIPDTSGKYATLMAQSTSAFGNLNENSIAQTDSNNKYMQKIKERTLAGGGSKANALGALPFSGSSVNEDGAQNQFKNSSNASIPSSSENVNYPAPFGMNPIEWGRRMRRAANAKTALEKTAALYDVAPEVYAAAEKLAEEAGARIVFDGTLRGNENGYYQNGEIHINPNAEESFTTVFAHELTHHLEGTGAYHALSDYVLSHFGGEEAISKAIEQKIAEYDRSSSGRVKLSEADARTELVAEYISENLFTNEAEISRLAKSDLSLAQRVKNFISRLAAKVTGNTEKLYLLNAERLYQRAIKEARDTDARTEVGARREMLYGQAFSEDKYFARQIDRWNELASGERVKVGNVRQGSALNQVGLPNAGMYFDVGKIKKAMVSHGDHLTAGILKGIPDLLNDPIVITEYAGTDGTVKNTVNVYGNLFANGKPVVVGVVMHLDRSGRNVISNIRTIHARSNFAKQITDRSVLYLNEDKRKTRSWFQVCGNLNVPLEGTKYGLIRSIAFDGENSNREFSLSSDQQNAVDKAVRMLDNGSTPNEVYAQTGLVVMANGDIFDKMIGGEKIGEYQHGNAQNELGGISENVQGDLSRVDRRENQRRLGRSAETVRLQDWKELDARDKQQIVSAVEKRMTGTSEEGKYAVEELGGIEPFTQRFYSTLQQGRPAAEQWANLIPDIQGLMDEIETAADETSGRKYSLAEKGTPAPDPDYQQMVEKYGAVPEGEKPHGREVQVPASTDGKDAVSQYARTLMEAPQTPEEFLPAFQQQVKNGLFSHDPVRDKDSLDRAARVLEKYGWQEGMKRWQQVVDGERKAGKDDIVLAQVMYAEACKVKDQETAQRLAAEIATEGTLSGQAVQALRLLKRTTPEGQLYYIQKTAKALQDGLERKLGKKWKDKIEIDKDLAQKFLDAQTQEERDAALDDLYDDVARQLPRTREDICNAWRYFAMLGNPRTHIRNVVGNVAFQAPVRAKNKIGAVIELARPRDERTKSLYTTKAAREFAKADYGKMADVMGGGKYSEMQEIKSRQKVLPGWVDKASKLNSKALDVEDALFKRMTYINSMAQFLTARKVDVNNINENTLEQARSYAMNEALRATFNDASALANAINKLEKTNAASKFIVGGLVPFKRTPVNIVKRGIEYSPVGLIKGITYDAVQVRRGLMSATDMIDHISAGLTGSGIVALGMFLRAMGWVTGEGDEDDKKRYFDEAQGEQSYSLNIGDYSYTIDWAAPAALPLFVGVELWDALQGSAKGELSFKSVLESTEKLFNPVLELTMMSGVSDTLRSAVYSPEGMMSAALTSVGTSYLGQFVPTLFGQIARTIDPVSRSTYHEGDSPLPKSIDKFLQKQANKIPGLSQNQIPYMDVWGRPEVNENTALRAFENFLSPGYVEKKSSSPGEQELLRLYQATGNSAVLPGRAQSTLTIDGEKVYLKAGEYAQYASERGRSSLKILNQAAENPMYQNMDDLTKVGFIQKLYQYADQTAKGKFTSFVPENWVEGVQAAVKAGIPADTAIAYRVLAADMDSGEKLELMEGMELADEKKRLLYEKSISEDHGERIDAVLDAGLEFNDFLNIQKEYGVYYNDDTMEAGDKATEFSRWFDQQYDVEGAAKIKEQFKFFSFAPAESKYDKFTAAGMSEDGAYALNNALGELEPLEGKEKVSDAQKLAEIVFSGNYQKEDVEAALSVTMGDQYEKLEAAQEAGISTEAFMDYYMGARGLGSDKDENGKAIKGRGEKIKQMTYIDDIPGLSVEQKDYIYLNVEKWAESTLDEAPWHGGPRYEGELPEHYSVKDGGSASEEQPAAEQPENTGDSSTSDTGNTGGSSGGGSGGSSGQRRNSGAARTAVQQSGKILKGLLSTSVSPSLPKPQGTLNTGVRRSGTRALSLTLPTVPRVVRTGTKGKYAKKIITPYDSGQILSRALANAPDQKFKKL